MSSDIYRYQQIPIFFQDPASKSYPGEPILKGQMPNPGKPELKIED